MLEITNISMIHLHNMITVIILTKTGYICTERQRERERNINSCSSYAVDCGVPPASHHGPRVVVSSLQLARRLDVARGPHDVVRCAAVRPRPGLRGVGEGEPGGVDDPVIAD